MRVSVLQQKGYLHRAAVNLKLPHRRLPGCAIPVGTRKERRREELFLLRDAIRLPVHSSWTLLALGALKCIRYRAGQAPSQP